jgi:hypothetical protein
VALELRTQPPEDGSHLAERGQLGAVRTNDLVRQEGEAGQLLAQEAVVHGDNVVAEVGERGGRPVGSLVGVGRGRVEPGDGLLQREAALAAGVCEASLPAAAVVDPELLEHPAPCGTLDHQLGHGPRRVDRHPS